MRKGVAWIGGMVAGIAFVMSCGTGINHTMTTVADMLGLDGFVGDGGKLGDAKAAPGSPTSCTPGEAFCEDNKLWFCTYSGADAYGGGDCAVSYPSATNPGVCTTTGCPGGG